MSIAIKELTEKDKSDFDAFLKTERKILPKLKLSSLVPPHEDMAVMAFKNNNLKISEVEQFAQKNCFVLENQNNSIYSLSRRKSVVAQNNSKYIFSGYVYLDGTMLIGANEVEGAVKNTESLRERCGEYCLCTIANGQICLTSDYFGMVPWFYFDNSDIFIASNNYHMMLSLLKNLNVNLEMNIARSRVNLITTGFTYGSSFSKDLDIKGCKMNFAYEKIKYSFTDGLTTNKTSLWNVINDVPKWDEDLYDDYIAAAKEELYEYCRAAFEHPRFNKIVVDVSGGFDSRVVFAIANSLPKRLRKKLYTFTRRSGTSDDIEKANGITNIYGYPKHVYSAVDTSNLYDVDGTINLAHVSRNLGVYSVCSYLYSAKYYDECTLEITGYLGEVTLGYKRCRGELDYSLGDKKLLARIGGSYWWNSVAELQDVFKDQEQIINDTLSNYNCDCLFKKFQALYVDSRNRFICNSSHNVENNNMRIPMLFSKNALKAKWLYFSLFKNNEVPKEKVSIDLLNAINPLLASMPFAANNNDVIPSADQLLNPAKIEIHPDMTKVAGPAAKNTINLYKDKVIKYIDDLDILSQMILHIYDYSPQYYSVCLALYKMLDILKSQPEELKSSHARETIRKVYDIYFQIQILGEK